MLALGFACPRAAYRRRFYLVTIVMLLPALALTRAQTGVSNRQIDVNETTGIRRTEYPVTARVELPRGSLRDASNARLKLTEDVIAQFTAETTWDDGSVRALSVDFNVSLGPAERRRYVLEFGADVKSAAPAGRGLSVTEDADAIQVGNIRFGRTGSPLVLAANYVKMNFIGTGRNGISVTDTNGPPHNLSSAQDLKLDVVKRGPLRVALRYAGRLSLDQAAAAPFVITMEMPNSKSWLKTSAVVQDPSRRIRALAFDSPLAFGALPWTWDVGTENGTCGAFRNATDTAVLLPDGQSERTRRLDGPHWQRGGALGDYESSPTGRAASGWGHLLDARGAVAFGVADFAREQGAYRIALSGSGQTSFSFEPSRQATEHRITVYQHFVSTPVPIGAATSPTAMLSPLKVEIRP
jgi:hypothetical protein